MVIIPRGRSDSPVKTLESETLPGHSPPVAKILNLPGTEGSGIEAPCLYGVGPFPWGHWVFSGPMPRWCTYSAPLSRCHFGGSKFWGSAEPITGLH